MIDCAPLTFRVEPMRGRDLGEVMEIERVSFTAPWSMHAYDYELNYNQTAHYCVARMQSRPEHALSSVSAKPSRSFWQRLFANGAAEELAREPVVGYAGFWQMVDEAHVSTLAVARQQRRRGIGELLLIAMIDRAQEVGARVMTLEVRKSNLSAQALYRKYDFEFVGERRQYYSDNGEDAWIMTSPEITTASFNGQFQELTAALFERLSG